MMAKYEAEATFEDIHHAFPGAINVANLLRAVAWLCVALAVLGGTVVGAASMENRAAGVLVGATVGTVVGAISASGTFALAYILLLLNEIEQNTRVTASGNRLSE